VKLEDGESDNPDDEAGSSWNKGEGIANNSIDVTERERRFRDADPFVYGRVSNKMNDNGQNLMGMETQASFTAMADEKSASVTPPPPAITTDSSYTIHMPSSLQREVADFPP